MSFSDMLHRVTGRKATPEVATPAPATPEPTPASEPDTSGFKFPEINADDPDFEKKTAIHAAYQQLAESLTKNTPHIDWSKEYETLSQKNGPAPERKNPGLLSSFAIALGGGDKALDRQKETYDRAHEESTAKWKEIGSMRESAMKGDIQQKLQKGQFKQALAQSEALAHLQATLERSDDTRAHTNKMEEITAANKGKENVARIRADYAKTQMETRLRTLADSYKLDGKVRLAFMSAMSSMLARRMSAQDVTGEMSIPQEDLKSAMEEAAHMAETLSGEDFSVPPPHPSAAGGPAKTVTPKKAEAPVKETEAQRVRREIREEKAKQGSAPVAPAGQH